MFKSNASKNKKKAKLMLKMLVLKNLLKILLANSQSCSIFCVYKTRKRHNHNVILLENGCATTLLTYHFCVAADSIFNFQKTRSSRKGQQLGTVKYGSARCNVETHHRVAATAAAAANENDFVNTPATARFFSEMVI